MSGTCDCDGCRGLGPATPQGLHNRDGLSEVGYRIGDHARFQASMLAALSSSTHAALSRLTTRASDDFTLGLIDAFACTADVLTFYSERIANESWLRTATERFSLQEMGKLVGYRLRPGVAAEAWLAFALETPPTPPANLPPEPGNFVTGVPERVRIEAGLPVQSVPGPDEAPQTFETVEALEARPAWNAMRPWMSAPARPAAGDTRAFLSRLRDRPRPGDGILFLGEQHLSGADPAQWDFRVIQAVDFDAATQVTQVSWSQGLVRMPAAGTEAGDSEIHLLRRRASVFGHNAPLWDGLSDDIRRRFTRLAELDEVATRWPGFNGSPDMPDEAGGAIDLDAAYPDLHAGGYIVLRAATERRRNRAESGAVEGLFRIEDSDEISRADFGMAAKVSRLYLSGRSMETFWSRVRETSVYLSSERVRAAERPVDGDVEGAWVPVAIDTAHLQPGRRVLVRGALAGNGMPVVHPATLVGARTLGPSRCLLEISPPIPGALLRASVVVHANVAPATHGESVTQVLGSGDGAAHFQSFELRHAPLTWLAAGNELGASSALIVRVGGIEWKQRDSLFGAAPAARAYQLTTDDQGKTRIVFGDGIRGARLPTGTNNLVATYRKGLGAGGNVAAGKLTQLMSRPLGLKSVENLLPAEGGTDPESTLAARQTLPLATRTLGRVVSVLDYEDFARAFTGVAKARACVLQPAGGTTIVVTIAGDKDTCLTPSSPAWVHLSDALRGCGDPHAPVQLMSHQPATFQLGLRVKCDPAYPQARVLADVEAALRAGFSFDARALGQAVQQSELIATAHGVAGVIAVDLTRFDRGGPPGLPPRVRLLASRMRVDGGVLAPEELLTLHPGPLFQLEAMT